MSRRRKKSEPTQTPVYVFDINKQTGEPQVKELSVVQEQEPKQKRFTLLSGNLTGAFIRSRELQQDPPRPGA